MLVLFACGTVSQTYGIFLQAMAQELGTSMGSISVSVTILNAVMVLFGPFGTRLVNRFGMHRCLTLGLCGMAASVGLLSLCTALYPVYLLYALCGCCMYFGLYFLCPYIVNRWFRVRVAETMALIIMTMAVGGAVGNLALSAILQASSWQCAYRWEGGFLLAVAGVAFLLLRDDPSELGMEPYGSGGVQVQKQTDRTSGGGLTLSQALRRPEFWFITFYVACMQFCVSMQSQIPTLAVSIGLSAAVGATAASLNSMGGIPAKALLSVLNVKLGVVASVLLYNTVGILGILGVVVLKNTAGLSLFAALFGFTIGSTTVQLPLLTNRLFGASREYGAIHARVVMISGLLATPGSILAGTVYDKAGSYTPMLLLLALLLLLGICFARGAWRRAR